MSKQTRRNLPFLLCLVLVSGLFLTKLSGCTAQQIESLKGARAELVAGADKLKSEKAKLEADIATRQPDDPALPALKKTLEVLDKGIAEYDKRLPALDASIAAAEKGELTPELQRELERIPVVGPYMTLIFAAGGFALYLLE